MISDIPEDIITVIVPNQHRPKQLFHYLINNFQKNLLKGYITPSPDREGFTLNMKIDIDANADKEYIITIDDIDGQTDKIEAIISKCIFQNYNEMGI